MDLRKSNDTAESLANLAEKGEKEAFTRLLNSVSIEERLAVVQQADLINDSHRQKNPNLPDLQILTTNDLSVPGKRNLSDVHIDKGELGKFNIRRLLGETRQKQDIYDLPSIEVSGKELPFSKSINGLLRSVSDGFAVKRRSLDEVLKSQ